MTVLEAIKRGADFLEKKGVESPRLQVELLLAHILGLPRMKLYLNFDRALSEGELERSRELLRRRGLREPLQHIVGSTSFCGIELMVSREALVPRPETELLAEEGWKFLNSIPPANETGPLALDFGTGSGCLAIALTVNSPRARCVALDISPGALDLARRNAARHQMESRIEFAVGDGFAAVPSGARFDLIVSNPPYIPSAQIPTLEPEVRDFDPRLALDGGADGLEFYRRLASEAGAFLKVGGIILLELGDGQAVSVEKMFGEQKWVVETVKPDYNRHLRVLVARGIQ